MPGTTSCHLNPLSPLVQPIFHSPGNLSVHSIILHFSYKEPLKFCSPLIHINNGLFEEVKKIFLSKSVFSFPSHLFQLCLEMASRKTGSVIFLRTLIRLPSLKLCSCYSLSCCFSHPPQISVPPQKQPAPPCHLSNVCLCYVAHPHFHL